MKPTEVRIIEPLENMTVGQRVELVCQSSGSRPPAKITWKKNQKLLEHYSESTSDDGTVTTNFLTFVPTKEDNGIILACTAFNPQFSDFKIEDTLHLDVHCNEPVVVVSLKCTDYYEFIFVRCCCWCWCCRCAHFIIVAWSQCSTTRDSRRK